MNTKTFQKLISLLALIGAIALAASTASAANLLSNPSFEANSGHALPVAWTYFAPPSAAANSNFWIEGNVPRHSPSAGALYWKQWSALNSATVTNVAGIYQSFSSSAGSV